jgi:putative serine protease PepD
MLTPRNVAVAVALLVALLAGALTWKRLDDQRDEIAGLRRELAAATKSANAQRAATDATTRDLSLRVGTLEAAAQNTPDPVALSQQTMPSVFTIETDFGLGSAWVAASTNGTSLLVTNFHVIADTYDNGGNTVHVKQADKVYLGTIVHTSAADDLAIVSVPIALPALTVDTAEPKPGDAVLVVGSPLGLEGTVSSGIVSAMRTEDGVRYIQFTAPISPGNSGGPVLDAHGKVIGVSVAKAVSEGVEGLGFAVPAARVCASFDVC